MRQKGPGGNLALGMGVGGVCTADWLSWSNSGGRKGSTSCTVACNWKSAYLCIQTVTNFEFFKASFIFRTEPVQSSLWRTLCQYKYVLILKLSENYFRNFEKSRVICSISEMLCKKSQIWAISMSVFSCVIGWLCGCMCQEYLHNDGEIITYDSACA